MSLTEFLNEKEKYETFFDKFLNEKANYGNVHLESEVDTNTRQFIKKY